MGSSEGFLERSGPHDAWEIEVMQELQSLGYHVASATYHRTLPGGMQVLLKKFYTVESMYIRARADRIAIHPTDPICFEWEAKSDPGNYHNLSIELMPTIINARRSRHGPDTLYCYLDLKSRREFGFWISRIPTPIEIVLPLRRDCIPIHDLLRRESGHHFPGVPIRESGRTRGSGTPFLLIDGDTKDAMPDWRGLLPYAHARHVHVPRDATGLIPHARLDA